MVAGNGSRVVVEVLDGDVLVAVWQVDNLACADLLVLDTVARLRLAARRLGWSTRLRHSGGNLRPLLDLAGLADVVADVVADAAGLRLQAGREAEGGEQAGVQDVEEVVEPGDPAA